MERSFIDDQKMVSSIGRITNRGGKGVKTISITEKQAI
jgi:hypothetical protein